MKNETEYIQDIEIAQNALKESFIDVIVKERDLLCDVYCIPSHNHQAFYLQIYDGNEYALIFAKPCIQDAAGCIVMYPFEWTIQANKHTVKKGDIYCGIKYIPKNNLTINKLIDCLPTMDEWSSVDITIDGYTTIIRNYKLKDKPLLGYRNAKKIKHLQLSNKQIEFMDDLYIHIEDIIGNLTNIFV